MSVKKKKTHGDHNLQCKIRDDLMPKEFLFFFFVDQIWPFFFSLLFRREKQNKNENIILVLLFYFNFFFLTPHFVS